MSWHESGSAGPRWSAAALQLAVGPARRTVHTTLRALERFLLPNSCVVCERAIECATPDALVCAVCRIRMRPVAPGCTRCGESMPLIGPCRFCVHWPPALQSVRSAVLLTPEARGIVHHLKYQGYESLATLMAAWIAKSVSRPASATIIPIPMARRRARVRGFHVRAGIAVSDPGTPLRTPERCTAKHYHRDRGEYQRWL